MSVTVNVSGGDKADQYIRDLGEKLGRGKTVRVGFLEGATYQNGTPVAMVAAIQNFGAPSRGIPPRPFFTNMVKDKSSDWGDGLAMALERRNNDSALALADVGQGISGQLQQSIIDTNGPPLSPITLMLRKWFWSNPEDITGTDVGRAAAAVKAGESTAGVSTKPLEWTKHMLQSVSSEVKT